MSETIKKSRILVADTSTAMLHVLKNFMEKHGYEADCYSDPDQVCTALGKRFQNFESDYRCVVLGWPEGAVDIYTDLLALLVSTDQLDLPVILVCHELTTEIQTLVKRRPKTRVLLWKDYQSAADIIDRLAIAAPATKPPQAANTAVDRSAGKSAQQANPQTSNAVNAATPVRALLLDSAPSICRDLRKLMESNGYLVTVAGTVEEGRKSIESGHFDLVVTDFFLRGEGGEKFCRYLQSEAKLPGRKPVCVVLASKSSDALVKRSLAVGALSCLYKGEATELIFARLHALVNAFVLARADGRAQQFASTRLLEFIPEPAILLDNKGVIAGVNQLAKTLLDDNDQHDVTSREVTAAICRSPIKTDAPCNIRFLAPSGRQASVAYIAAKIDIANAQPGVLIRLNAASLKVAGIASSPAVAIGAVAKPLQQAKTQAQAQSETKTETLTETKTETETETETRAHAPVNTPVKPVVQVSATAPIASTSVAVGSKVAVEEAVNSIDEFTRNTTLLLKPDSGGARHSVLVLDIQLIAATGDRLCIGHSKPMLNIVYQSLSRLYTRENSFNYLGDGQFGFLLATRRHQDALVLTRKLLEVVPQMVKYLNNMSLVAHGGVLQLQKDSGLDAEQVINKCRTACAKARGDKRDNAVLVMPMNKYLTRTIHEDSPLSGNSAKQVA